MEDADIVALYWDRDESAITETDMECVETVRQNYGFDWENGVSAVTLDSGEEHYFLEVRRAAAD